MKKINSNNKLAIQMLIAMVSGIVVGLGFMAIREKVGADSALWSMLNRILFQNISAAGGESALGLFYIGGQLFIRALQLVIVPMVFSSVVMAICEVNEARTLGRIAAEAKKAGIVVVEVDRRKLDSMSTTHSHQGGITEKYDNHNKADDNSPHCD